MTKQEEIRQRTIEILVKPLKVPYQEDAAEMIVQGAINQAEEILSYLHSQGVVIKVKRKLPEEGIAMESKEFNDGFDKGQSYYKMQIRKAGYVAVEPLIKEMK